MFYNYWLFCFLIISNGLISSVLAETRDGSDLKNKSWNEMIGMPSRLTAPKEERSKREDDLNAVRRSHFIKGYQAIRINSKGQLFQIKNAKIWTLLDLNGRAYGQAATFDSWHMIKS